MSTQDHINHILSLNKSERVSIAQLLWDSITSTDEALDVLQEEKNLLDDRKLQFDSGEIEGDKWQNVKERLLAKK